MKFLDKFTKKYKSVSMLRKLRKEQNVKVIKPYYIEDIEKLSLMGAAYIGPHCYWSCTGGLDIGDNVIIGPHSKIWTTNHNFNSKVSIPYGGKDIFKKVKIAKNVWIGLGVTILPGTELGEGCVVSAGSVVRGTFEPHSLIAGNPARTFGKRNIENYKKCADNGLLYLHGKTF